MIARPVVTVAAIAATTALASCGHGTNETGASYSESRQLNEAAASLDADQANAAPTNDHNDDADDNGDQGDTR